MKATKICASILCSEAEWEPEPQVSGSIGWHFSIYAGHSNNFGGSRLKKIKYRDDSSSRMSPGETWHETFTVLGPATYVLDFSDWDDNPQVEVRLIIDDILRLITLIYAISYERQLT